MCFILVYYNTDANEELDPNNVISCDPLHPPAADQIFAYGRYNNLGKLGCIAE